MQDGEVYLQFQSIGLQNYLLVNHRFWHSTWTLLFSMDPWIGRMNEQASDRLAVHWFIVNILFQLVYFICLRSFVLHDIVIGEMLILIINKENVWACNIEIFFMDYKRKLCKMALVVKVLSSVLLHLRLHLLNNFISVTTLNVSKCNSGRLRTRLGNLMF